MRNDFHFLLLDYFYEGSFLMIKGYVNSLETFGLVDGPGVRFVVFLQGCKLRCKFCHNPETWSLSGGDEWSPENLFNHVRRYKTYWKNNGGITVSGGEPLLQMEFVTEFFKLAKKENIHTAIDTAGQPFSEEREYLDKFGELMKFTDLVILDIKEWESDKHRDLTGFGNENIIAMARWLSDNDKKMWIRHVLVPKVTDNENSLREMHGFIKTLKTVEKVEILPYHTLGLMKWEKLGIPYSLAGVSVPSEAQIKNAEDILINGK